MRIVLKLRLNCSPDAAWNAIRDPDVFRAASAPLTTFRSLESTGFPRQWPSGTHLVAVRALGIVPLGHQEITISYPAAPPGVRMMRDSGGGVSGALTAVTYWRHSMAISAANDGATLYRDQLEFSARPATILLWPVYWLFWQWRAHALKTLAPRWV